MHLIIGHNEAEKYQLDIEKWECCWLNISLLVVLEFIMHILSLITNNFLYAQWLQTTFYALYHKFTAKVILLQWMMNNNEIKISLLTFSGSSLSVWWCNVILLCSSCLLLYGPMLTVLWDSKSIGTLLDVMLSGHLIEEQFEPCGNDMFARIVLDK